MDELFQIIHKKIDPDFTPNSILDYGCGPVRMLMSFSKRAEKVIEIDISQGMLDIVKKNCKTYGIKNVSTVPADNHLNGLGNETFCLVHSFIVLQHLNVKRGEKLFNELLDRIEPRGIGVLHVLYHDNKPMRRVVNFLRFRIPFVWYLFRMMNSRFFTKKAHFYPQMQMNNYHINRMYYLLQKRFITDIYIQFTNHYNYWGLSLFFKKPKNID